MPAPFPGVVNTTTFQNSTAATTSAVPLPQPPIVGALLLVYIAIGNSGSSITTPTGWSLLTNTSPNRNFSIFYRTTDGTEGAIVTVTHTSLKAAAIAYQITNWAGAPEFTVATSGASANPQSGALSPSWGPNWTLFLSLINDDGGESITSIPANYSNGIGASTTTSAAASAWGAQRYKFDNTDTPGTWTMGVSATWTGTTVAIKPARKTIVRPWLPFVFAAA